MLKQFLLNPDGSVPANTDVELLNAEGIRLTMPTEMPSSPGMVAIEQEPQQDADGVWRQVWVLEPAPETQPELLVESDPLAFLTIEQKQALAKLLTDRG